MQDDREEYFAEAELLAKTLDFNEVFACSQRRTDKRVGSVGRQVKLEALDHLAVEAAAATAAAEEVSRGRGQRIGREVVAGKERLNLVGKKQELAELENQVKRLHMHTHILKNTHLMQGYVGIKILASQFHSTIPIHTNKFEGLCSRLDLVGRNQIQLSCGRRRRIISP